MTTLQVTYRSNVLAMDQNKLDSGGTTPVILRNNGNGHNEFTTMESSKMANANFTGGIDSGDDSVSFVGINDTGILSVSTRATSNSTSLEDITKNTGVLVHTDSYIQHLHDDSIMLNTRISRVSPSSLNSVNCKQQKYHIPFQAKKHSQMLPVAPSELLKCASKQLERSITINLLPNTSKNTRWYDNDEYSTMSLPNVIKCPEEDNGIGPNGKKNSDLANHEIKHHNTMFSKVTSRTQKIIRNDVVDKKHLNVIIVNNMLLGIKAAGLKSLSLNVKTIANDLIEEDYIYNEKFIFDYSGNENRDNNQSQYMFKFKDYSPDIFYQIREKCGVDTKEYLDSITSNHIMSEFNSPGKSGSFFYYSKDFKYIIKTIHHSEHIHLRKYLKHYYTHIASNPDTLISQFYGLHRIKLPISFENTIRKRKIYLLVMNNVLPLHLKMHRTFDLKGSTWGRLTKSIPNTEDNNISDMPILKDLNWLQQKERIQIGSHKKKILLTTLKNDIEFLNEIFVMDYSLLIGVHYIDKNEYVETTIDPSSRMISLNFSKKNIRENQLINNHVEQCRNGIVGKETSSDDSNVVYFFGIIDCLTNYSLIKKLETVWRSLNHDLRVVSAIPPKQYSHRFYDFIENSTE